MFSKSTTLHEPIKKEPSEKYVSMNDTFNKETVVTFQVALGHSEIRFKVEKSRKPG